MQSLNRASAAGSDRPIRVKHLGRADYEPTWRAMQSFTAARSEETPDELWVVEHPPVYTVGVAGRSAHLPRERIDIPLVRIDRGGQITYHGPGQVVVYLLLDMKRRGITVRPLVRLMETAVIDSLADFGIAAAGRVEAPGVYVGAAKIAALGLRVTRGCCYHGLALNVDMDLSPFSDIDPCGYPGLSVTRLKDLGVDAPFELVADKVTQHLMRLLK
ncbi:MAG TPA: lipoyl(octanoyl) transferase LipB [Burkholderiales bacterium]|nr:lipoyl(octanoyl) transferase LipB [Burkholderiales bacterium]